MPRVVLLGPQRFTPTLGEVVDRLGVGGKLASVTAGWQERETEDLDLHEHLGERTVNLRLYARGEELFERDAELASGYRERQELMRALQETYRVRLAHAQAALRELAQRTGNLEALDAARDSALAAIRALDREHLERVASVHAEFERRWRPGERPALARSRRQVAQVLDGVEAIAIAGGHVAVLLNRLRLFGLDRALAGRTVFAWSAGAMAIAERVVLFHHSPPQGYGNTEVLENGLGLAPGIVPFPHAERRLDLGDRRRIGLLARRFAPATCVAMTDGAWLVRDGERWVGGPGMRRLLPDGGLTPMELA